MGSHHEDGEFRPAPRSRPGSREREEELMRSGRYYRTRNGQIVPRKAPKKRDPRELRAKERLQNAVSALREYCLEKGYTKGEVVQDDRDQARLVADLSVAKSEYKRIRAYFRPDKRDSSKKGASSGDSTDDD